MSIDKKPVARMISMRRNANSIAYNNEDLGDARRTAPRNLQYRAAAVFYCAVMSLATLATLGCTRQREPSKSSPATIVFICEHGAAKSVIAAAYFNKLAAERHISFHAIARGLRPQPDLSSAAVAGLEKDRVSFSKEKPRPFTPEEVQTAVRVIAFCPLPESLAEGRLQSFDVPAPKDGYATSRDAIVVQVNAIIEQLASQHRQRKATGTNALPPIAQRLKHAAFDQLQRVLLRFLGLAASFEHYGANSRQRSAVKHETSGALFSMKCRI